jgi:hypothetical protein
VNVLEALGNMDTKGNEESRNRIDAGVSFVCKERAIKHGRYFKVAVTL